MAKYVLATAATAVSAYYGYQYFEIYKEKLQDYLNNFLQTLKNTESTLSELEKRVEALENSLRNSNDTTDSLSNSYTNGEESFSFITNDDKQEKPATNNAKKIIATDPYVAEVLKVIKNIRKEAADLEERVRYYRGSAGDRVFKQFNEKIIRLLISLDRVDVKGFARLKEEKKDAIAYLKEIQGVLKTR